MRPAATGDSRRWSPPRRGAVNLALAALALAVSLAAPEVLLRLTWTAERVTLEYDPLLGFRGRAHASTEWTREMAGRPRRVRLNAEGFHDHERRHTKPAGTRRVAFLGDSFVEAYQVPVDSSYVQRLGRRWRRRAAPLDFDVEAVNLGVHGYGLGTQVLLVRHRLPAWQPDAVVLSLFLGNDLYDNFTPVASPAVPRFHLEEGRLVALPAPPPDARTWLRDHVLARSVLVRFVWMRLIKSHGGAMRAARAAGLVSTPDLASDAAGRTAEMVAVGRLLLGDIAAELRRRHVPLFVFVIPDPFLVQDRVDEAQRATQRLAPAAVRARRVAVEAGVLQTLADLEVPHLYPRDRFVRARLEGRGVYRNGFGHFTDAAHRVVADLLEAPGWALLSPAARRDR